MNWISNIGILCLTVLHLIALRRFWTFYKLKVCGNTELSKSIGAIFLTAFAHFGTLCYNLVTWNISNFSLLLYRIKDLYLRYINTPFCCSVTKLCLTLTPWTTACQTPLSTVSQSLLKFMSIELVML